MTRLATCGYETGDVNEAGSSTIGASMTLTVVASTPTPRAGSYCLKVLNTTATKNATYKSFAVGAQTDAWVRFAFFSHQVPAVGRTEVAIAVWLDAGGGTQTSLSYSYNDGLLRVYNGTFVSTLLDTSSTGFGVDTWHLLEWRTQISSATSGTSELWLDGVRVINFSGDNTATATLNVQTLQLGWPVGAVTVNNQNTNDYIAFDDIAINNASGTLNNGRPGDGRIVLLTPNGAGSNTGLTRGGTDTGANYSQCSEVPPSLTQYVFSATAAARDTYALSNLPAGVASINVAEVLVLAQNSDAGAGSLGLTVKSGATTNEGSAQALSSTAGYVRQLYETDPATSTAWTSTAINALEAGVTVR